MFEQLDGAYLHNPSEDQILEGVEGNLTQARAKIIPGFMGNVISEQKIIAGDNSTVVEVSYRRLSYTISFATTATGSYAASINKKFGDSITADLPVNPSRPGYTFVGWDWNGDGVFDSNDTSPATMPAENRIVHAIWEPGTAECAVVYWLGNANDSSYAAMATLTTTGTVEQPATAEYLNANASSPFFYGHAIKATGPMGSADFNELSYYVGSSIEEDVVQGDGSTVINVFYTPKTYTVQYWTTIWKRLGAMDFYTIDQGGQHFYTRHSFQAKYGQFFGDEWLAIPELADVSAHPEYKTGLFEASLAYGTTYRPDSTVLFEKWKDASGVEHRTPPKMLTRQMIDDPNGTTATFQALWFNSKQIYQVVEYYYDGVFIEKELITNWETRLDVPEREGVTRVKTVLRYVIGDYTNTEHPEYNYVSPTLKTTWKARYTRNTYTLSMDPNGGSISGNPSAIVQDRKYGLSIEDAMSLVPSRLGYTFKGWFTSPNVDFTDPMGVEDYRYTGTTMPPNHLYLFAGWEINQYTLSAYDTKGGTLVAEPLAYPYNSIPVAPQAPTRTGYIFDGWYEMSNDAPYIPSAMTANQEIYAKWLVGGQVEYVVHYYLEDSTTPLAPSLTKLALPEEIKTENPVYVYGHVPLTLTAQTLLVTAQGPNALIFYYRPVTSVPYTIRYLDAGRLADGIIKELQVQAPGQLPVGKYTIITQVNNTVIADHNRHNLAALVRYDGDVANHLNGQPYYMDFTYDPILKYQSADVDMGAVAGVQEAVFSSGRPVGSTATALPGYIFQHWKNEAGTIVSTNATYQPAVADTTSSDAYLVPHTFTAYFARYIDVTNPTIATISDVTVPENIKITPIPVNAQDESGFDPIISTDNLPVGLAYHTASKDIQGTPTVSDWADGEESRPYLVTVTATDEAGNSTGTTFTITVTRAALVEYRVEHYLADTLVETEILTGRAGDSVSATPKSYEGYTYNEAASMDTKTGVIASDGSLVLKLYYFDSTPPLAPVINPVTTASETVTGTGEPGATVEVTWPGGSTSNHLVDDTGSWTAEIPSTVELVEDDIITATQQDPAGNTSPKTTETVTDGIAPEAPVINPVTTASETVTGTGEPGATVEVTWPGGSTSNHLVDDTGSWTAEIPSTVELVEDDIITATQQDPAGNTSPKTTVTVTDGDAPVISPIEDVKVIENIAITAIPVEASDDSGIPPTVTVEGLPSGLTFNPDTGLIEGTPTVSDWGTAEEERPYEVTVTATDASGNEAQVTFTITVQRDTDGDGDPDVTDPDDDNDGIPDDQDPDPKVPDTTAPTLEPIDDMITIEKMPIIPIPVIASDDSGIPPTIIVEGLPGGVHYNPDTGMIEGTPTGLVWVGNDDETRDFTVTVTASDTNGNAVSVTFIKTVLRDNDGDGEPDVTDPDDDNDGIPDDQDDQPKDPDPKKPKYPSYFTTLRVPVAGATQLSGTGLPEASILVVLPDNSSLDAVVDAQGLWSIELVQSLELGMTITITQTDTEGYVLPSIQATIHP